MPHNLRKLGRFAVLLALIVQAGCARVTVKKVPTPTQYGHWTDRMQRKADKMEGIRFYLPRPFVQVRESFPIRSESFLVHGQVSPDGQYIIVGEVAANSGLAKYVATSTGVANVPLRDVIDLTDAEAIAKAEAGEDTPDANDKFDIGVSSTVINEEIVLPAPPKPTTPPSSPNLFQKLTGINERKTTNDNGAVAVQPLRGNNFDIVYMPDFEEQYVVSSKSGLGNARFEVNLGQGWSLQGFNSLTDNSELNKRIFDLIDSSTAIAEQLALQKFGLNLPDLPGGQSKTIRAQAGEERTTGVPGTDVTLKVTIIHYAAKGLYPVLKPREVQERLPAQEIFYSYLDLFKLKARTSGVSDFDPSALRRAQMATSNESKSFTIPKYPYQFISFNTFSYMAIEAIRNSTHPKGPFEHLYPPSGTADRSDPNEKVPAPITRTVVPKSKSTTQPNGDNKPVADRLKSAMEDKKAATNLVIETNEGDNPYRVIFVNGKNLLNGKITVRLDPTKPGTTPIPKVAKGAPLRAEVLRVIIGSVKIVIPDITDHLKEVEIENGDKVYETSSTPPPAAGGAPTTPLPGAGGAPTIPQPGPGNGASISPSLDRRSSESVKPVIIKNASFKSSASNVERQGSATKNDDKRATLRVNEWRAPQT